MTLQEYVDSGELLINAVAMTALFTVFILLAAFLIIAGIIIIHMWTKDFLQSKFGGKSK